MLATAAIDDALAGELPEQSAVSFDVIEVGVLRAAGGSGKVGVRYIHQPPATGPATQRRGFSHDTAALSSSSIWRRKVLFRAHSFDPTRKIGIILRSAA